MVFVVLDSRLDGQVQSVINKRRQTGHLVVVTAENVYLKFINVRMLACTVIRQWIKECTAVKITLREAQTGDG